MNYILTIFALWCVRRISPEGRGLSIVCRRDAITALTDLKWYLSND